MKILIQFVFLFVLLNHFAQASILQDLIDSTPAGERVPLVAGTTYHGNFILSKKVILDGMDSVVLDGDNKGSILLLEKGSDGSVIKNIKIINSGNSHDKVTAAIIIKSSKNTLTKIIVRNTLFGFDFKQSHNNIVTHNIISSKDVALGARGDAIRVWSSNKNIFRHNKIHDSRDMVVWYSYDNIIEDNEGWNNRYSLHFMYTGKTTVKRNKYRNSAVGIFLMYSWDSILEANEILFSQGGTGMGIGMKEVDNMKLINNKIVYCSTGIYLDQSPYKISAYNVIQGNTIAYNQRGVVFNSSLDRNVFKGNALIDNLQDISVHGNGNALGNIWEGNYWSKYEGFDRNNDGYGDKEFSIRLYLDQLWLDDQWLKFFYASPVLSVINFLARLAPFSEPRLLVVDTKPLFSMDDALRLSAKNLYFDISTLDLDFDDDDDNEAGETLYEEDENELEGYTSE